MHILIVGSRLSRCATSPFSLAVYVQCLRLFPPFWSINFYASIRLLPLRSAPWPEPQIAHTASLFAFIYTSLTTTAPVSSNRLRHLEHILHRLRESSFHPDRRSTLRQLIFARRTPDRSTVTRLHFRHFLRAYLLFRVSCRRRSREPIDFDAGAITTFTVTITLNVRTASALSIPFPFYSFLLYSRQLYSILKTFITRPAFMLSDKSK